MSTMVYGHDLLALERFMDDTRHMIEFDVLSWESLWAIRETESAFFSLTQAMKERLHLKAVGKLKYASTQK